MKPELIIVGAGGHAKVVADAVSALGDYTIKGFCDDTIAKGQEIWGGYSVIDNVLLTDVIADRSIYFIVAIGNNTHRIRLYENALDKFNPATIIHPSAIIGSSVKIGAGTVVLPMVVINSHSCIGENCIINSGVIVDHGCTIADHVHLLPGTIVGSHSVIASGYRSLLGEKIESESKK